MTSTESIRLSICDIYWTRNLGCSIGQKITRCISHIDRVDSSVNVRYLLCISWPENHKMHIAHRPSRLVNRRAISALFVSLGQKITSCISHIDRVDSSVDVRYLLCICWPENQDASSHIDRVDSSIDVRYLLCLYLLARKSQDAYRTSRSVATKNCAISQPPKLVWIEYSHWENMLHISFLIFPM